jgi:hypothetical protein
MSEQNHVGWHKVSKERRKAIAARYYQRHRKIIKLAMTLDIPMKEARTIYAREVVCTVRKTASESMASPIGLMVSMPGDSLFISFQSWIPATRLASTRTISAPWLPSPGPRLRTSAWRRGSAISIADQLQ